LKEGKVFNQSECINCKKESVVLKVPDNLCITYNWNKNKRKKLVAVDACIADEIKYLWSKGVITYGCCCGHGKEDPICLVNKECEGVLKKLGYEYSYNSELSCFEVNIERRINI